MIKAVIFDLDGTLLHTVPDITAAMNRALVACNLPPREQEVVETFLGGGILDAVTRAVPVGTDDETIQRVMEIYRDDYIAHCTDQTVLYDGVRELVDSLTCRGIKLMVLSNKTEATAQKIIRHFFPDGEFMATFGRATDRPLKPHVGAAGPVLEMLQLPPTEIAYVGDSNTDILFARAVGMLPVAAPWGYRSREELVEAGAELIAEKPTEIFTLLEPCF